MAATTQGVFRLCEINGVKYGSIIDVIAAFDAFHARVIWNKMRYITKHMYTQFAFEETTSPVADAETLMRIIYTLKGKNVEEFRIARVQSILPPFEFISDFIKNTKVVRSDTRKLICTKIQCEFLDTSNVRMCEIDGVKHVSVFDVITILANKDEQASTIWKIIIDDADNVYKYSKNIFPGQRSPTPVADSESILQIIYKMDGPHLDKFREQSFQESIYKLFKDQISTHLNDAYSRQTWMYVRVRLPDSCMHKDLQNPKQLTLDVIKFGITYSLKERNTNYMKDNAYMMFGFPCSNRYEAEIVENIIKYDFHNITVFGSREYVDSVKLAAALG